MNRILVNFDRLTSRALDKYPERSATIILACISMLCMVSAKYNHVIFDDTSASARVITAPKSDISQTECKLNVFPCGNVDTMWHGMKFKLVDSRQR